LFSYAFCLRLTNVGAWNVQAKALAIFFNAKAVVCECFSLAINVHVFPIYQRE
jgi:hypothetical protein